MKKAHVLGTVIFMLAFIGNMVFITWNTEGEDVFLGSSKVKIESDGWNLSRNNKSIGTIELPATLKGEKEEAISISKQISFLYAGEQYLCFRSAHNRIWVYVDGIPVYTYGIKGKYALSKAPGDVWNIIKLPGNSTEYNVEIIFESPYRMYSGKVPNVYTGSKTEIYTYILRRYIPYLFIGLVYILIACFVFTSYLVLRNLKLECGLYLTLTIVHLGMWFLVDSKLDQFIFHSPFLFSQLECILILTSPVVILAYILSLNEYRDDKMLEWLYWLSIANGIIVTIFTFLGMFDFVEAVPIVTGIWILLLAGIIRNSVRRLRKNRNVKPNWCDLGLIMLVLTGIHDLVFLSGYSELERGRWFPAGVFIFISIIVVEYERNFSAIYVKQIKDERFKVLAYTDALTGLKNRASFEEEMDTMRNYQEGSEMAYIVIVDINNLKWINDTLGHKQGDKAIITVARCIENVFSKAGLCYRIGGDEFCIIIHKINEIKVNYMLDKLTHDISNADFVTGHSLSVACGYEVYKGCQEKSVDDIFVQADKNMYACKQYMKLDKKNKVDRF